LFFPVALGDIAISFGRFHQIFVKRELHSAFFPPAAEKGSDEAGRMKSRQQAIILEEDEIEGCLHIDFRHFMEQITKRDVCLRKACNLF
jgi:hypothetical protein